MKKKSLNINTILIGLVLVLAVGTFAFQKLTSKKGAIATIYVGSVEIKQVNLSKDQRFDVTDGFIDVHLVVENGAIAFEHSECPDHLCEGFGFINQENEFAVCAPANVGVIITKGAE